MRYRLQFFPYRYRFKHPLNTAHGSWAVREGMTLQLTNEDGQIGLGEIAPIPWFGSETLEQAIEVCRQFSQIEDKDIFSIPDNLPACQFGFESAWEALQNSAHPEPSLSYSRLLPAGATALQTWQPLWEQGFHTFKWKIGVYPIDQELAMLDQLMQIVPASAKLRLDANCGLNLEQATQWLEQCDRLNESTATSIEYLEQPLLPAQLPEMLKLSDRYKTPLALDESVANLPDLKTCYEQGWRGVFVIKPAIFGSPSQLRQFCQTHFIDAVFSTVFETQIGRQAGLRLAAELGSDRAVGYDGNFYHFDYFEAPDYATSGLFQAAIG